MKYKTKVLIQRMMGIACLAVSIVIAVIAANGTTMEESDASVLFFTIPLGLCLLLNRDLILNI